MSMPTLYQTTMMEPQTILEPEQSEVSQVYENKEEMPEDPALPKHFQLISELSKSKSIRK